MSKEKTHWLKNPNKNYLGHFDLPESGELILTIESAKWEDVKNPVNNTSESKRVVRFKEKGIKPFICNETNAKSIAVSTGARFMEDSKGSKIVLFVDNIRDKKTKENIDCIRIKRENIEAIYDELVSLFKKNKSKLNESNLKRAEEIISSKESESYIKMIGYLKTL